MSQRLEPGEIFHNEIFILVKYPKSFPPCKTIPRGGQGSEPAWEKPSREPGGERGRETVTRWVRQAVWAVGDADP